jgi:16S rRNA (cytosine967-C5)-methyltransferase
VPGLAARRIAADILDGVLHKQRTLDDQLDGAGAHPGLKSLADRDRALMRRLVATILRRLGTLGHLLSRLLDRGVPTDAPRAQSALLIGAAQILWMDVPDHAAVDLSVRLVQSDRRAAKYAGLVNAVLRRCAREGQPLIDEVKAQTLDIPPWLLTRWIGAYGESTAREMATAIGHEPSLDITVKSDAQHWATRLHGEMLPTGTVRTLLQGSVTSAARPSSTSAPRRAARPPNWRTPARASPPSIARRRGWRGCASISRGFRCRPKLW